MLENFSGATRLIPIVGDPIAQVKSPFGVTQALEARGADAICVPMHIAPSDFAQFIATMRLMKNVDGLIITIPHKFAAYDVCDEVSASAAFLRSVNTIRRDAQGKLSGDAFDGIAYVASCRAEGCVFEGKKALLTGAGGAGTAIAHAVASAGVAELKIIDPDHTRRNDLIARLARAGFNVEAGVSIDAFSADLLLNASPMGMRAGDPLPFPQEAMRRECFVADVVTSPEVTALIAAARANGCKTSSGLAMFGKVRDLMVDFLLDRSTKT